MIDIWELIKNGHFEEACEKADLEYEQSGDIFPLRNKVHALLHLERYEECVKLTRELIRIRNGETDSDFIFCGIASWGLKRYDEAIETWMGGSNCKYTDAAGGIELQVILYYAAIVTNNTSLKDIAKKKIKKILKGKIWDSWPGPLGNYVLGEINERQLISKISKVAILKDRQSCQSDFVMALKSLENNNQSEWKTKLEHSLSHGKSGYLEQMYYLAKGDLNRVGLSL